MEIHRVSRYPGMTGIRVSGYRGYRGEGFPKGAMLLLGGPAEAMESLNGSLFAILEALLSAWNTHR